MLAFSFLFATRDAASHRGLGLWGSGLGLGLLTCSSKLLDGLGTWGVGGRGVEIPGLGAQEYDGWAMKGEGLLVPSALHEFVVPHPRNVL